jgi:chaperone modulatory protein CbpM
MPPSNPLDNRVLEQWVDAGWLMPSQDSGRPRFSDVDFARAQLIGDLKDLGVNDDGIPIILDLIDQLHGLRYLVHELLSTMRTQQQVSDR